MRSEPFVPPPYPFDRLNDIKALASEHPLGALDLSIGTPYDPPPDMVVKALSNSGLERGYLPSIGTNAYRQAAADWLNRTALDSAEGAAISGQDVIAVVGTKELVVGLPHWLRLRRPDLDTILYPAVSYSSYAMGAELGGCRAVPVPVDDHWQLDLGSIDEADAARALCLWVASPGNPTGASEDLEQIAAWGRAHDVPIFSDECYVEFTWDRDPQCILRNGTDGLVSVHSLSKRSNLAGTRAGFIAGDADILGFLGEIRQHAGLLVPGPVQAAAIAAFGDQGHVEQQRDRYRGRIAAMRARLGELGIPVAAPSGGFYLWIESPAGDGWAFARRLATELGVVGSPGEFYGDSCRNHLRLAMVHDVTGR